LWYRSKEVKFESIVFLLFAPLMIFRIHRAQNFDSSLA
jgi:hypothetical protein